jgi:hypothetical protein
MIVLSKSCQGKGFSLPTEYDNQKYQGWHTQTNSNQSQKNLLDYTNRVMAVFSCGPRIGPSDPVFSGLGLGWWDLKLVLIDFRFVVDHLCVKLKLNGPWCIHHWDLRLTAQKSEQQYLVNFFFYNKLGLISFAVVAEHSIFKRFLTHRNYVHFITSYIFSFESWNVELLERFVAWDVL